MNDVSLFKVSGVVTSGFGDPPQNFVSPYAI